MMREGLKQVNGLRKRFKGVFVRYGIKTNYKGFPEQTVLLKDVVCTSNSRICCDHCWFNFTKCFAGLDGLREGDVVLFDARVREYYKGYKGYREDVSIEHPLELDYKLSYPTNIKIVKPDGGKTFV